MSTRTIGQNITSGVSAGMIALVIYVAIAALFNKGVTGSIISTGLVYGLATLIITFLISQIISVLKAKG